MNFENLLTGFDWLVRNSLVPLSIKKGNMKMKEATSGSQNVRPLF